MPPHKNLSSYLVKPNLSARHRRSWDGFRSQFVEIRRYNPRMLSRSVGALLIWVVIIGSIRYINDPASLQLPNPATGSSSQAALTQTAPLQTPVTTSTLASVTRAQALPGGPSGDLMPPGTMAPDRTYRNSYAWGNCTWYVAGRRQIPAGWGNAATWYYHAVSNGWSVGSTPAVAAVAWTGASSSNRYLGHVALVERVSADGSQVYISEMNYLGLGIKGYRWVSAKSFKYIY